MNPAVLLKLLYDLQAQLMDAQVTITNLKNELIEERAKTDDRI